MTTNFYAKPYNFDAKGFYFESVEDYTAKSEGLTDAHGCPVEEFEIQLIDSDDADLISALNFDQCNFNVYFEQIENLSDSDKLALFYLVSEASYSLEQALEKLDEVQITEGTLKAAAEELFDELYLDSIPEAVRNYIDYEAFSRDIELSSEMAEFRHSGKIYTVLNVSSF